MPDLGTVSVSLTHCTPVKSLITDTSRDNDAENLVEVEVAESFCDGNCFCNVRRKSRGDKCTGKGSSSISSLEDHVDCWIEKKVELGFPPSRCVLPFLAGANRMVECLRCRRLIYPGERVSCSVRNCKGAYHLACAKERIGVSSSVESFRCQHHACYLCKQRYQWRCLRCNVASHDKCAAWPEDVIHFANNPGWAVCWKHPTDWRLDKNEQHVVPTKDIEEVFQRLPLPYVDEEFKIDLTWQVSENKLEPPTYAHIRRNVYLVKKKRSNTDNDVGCTNCGPRCHENCVCRVQCISCSRACHCSENCTNRPFRKDKKIKIVKTQLCGWGVVAAELVDKGEFVIEYIGEVIDDALCEQRLWDMKYEGAKNFYMCEIGKDFTIDATFKGNASRFLNHSCDPNCILEKWQVDGETRVGVFAARPITVGEPLTYDYRFVQFGHEVKCHCGASNCQGYLGSKRKEGGGGGGVLNICWGAKRKRSKSTAFLSALRHDGSLTLK